MTAESGLTYNGITKYMFRGAAYVRHPDLVIEKTVEVRILHSKLQSKMIILSYMILWTLRS